MSAPPRESSHECFSDFAILEYIMGRLAKEVRREIQEHFHTCKECASCHNQYALERDFITALFTTSSDAPPGLCPSDETLAQFLDNSLSDIERVKCECHLTVCSECQRELLEIYDDLNLLSVNTLEADTTIRQCPEGIILRMPQREPGSIAAQRIKWPVGEAGSA